MGADSKIDWTDHTFNPWIGCSKVSPGCEHCYAESESKRRGWAVWGKGKPRKRTTKANWRKPIAWNKEAFEKGRRVRVFCASLSDVFDAEVDPCWRNDLWELIRQTPCLDWLVLTKRPQNIPKMLPADWGQGWPNVCLMTSIEDHARLGRIQQLLNVPSRHWALSIEPLLEPIYLKPEWLRQLHWIIVGGESGRGARPMHPVWARTLLEQCEESGVAFFFKQWGAWSPDHKLQSASLSNAAYFEDPGGPPLFLHTLPPNERRSLLKSNLEGTFMFRAAKSKTGKKLDGRLYQRNPFGLAVKRMEIVQPLSGQELQEFKRCEDIIQRGLATFVDVGNALLRIRDSRLYRGSHNTFEEYVKSSLALSRPRAYELMDSSVVMKDLSAMADIEQLPINESQASELRRFKTPAARVAKWKEVLAASKDEPLTARFIRNTLQPRVKATASEKIRQSLVRLSAALNGTPIESKAKELIKKLEGLLAGL